MAAVSPNPSSVLGIACGSFFTRAALFERVQGRYRLIARGSARTTTDTHLLDGVARACEPIEILTGRRLFAQGELISGDVSGNRGVEALGLALTCQPALKVLAAGQEALEAAEATHSLAARLRPGNLAEHLAQIRSQSWDALIGNAGEMRLFQEIFPPGSDGAGPGIPRLIAGDGESIRQALSDLSLEQAAAALPGYAELAVAATAPVQTGLAALARLVRLIAQRFGLRLAVADCGASGATLALANPRGEVHLRRAAFDQRCLPASREELQAIHRQAAQAMAGLMPGLSADLLLGTGGILSEAPSAARAGLTLLDGARPHGVLRLAVDQAGIVSQLAAIAATLPDVAADVLEADGLVALGEAVCPQGLTPEGHPALDVTWSVNGGSAQSRTVKVGELARIPLAPGQRAEVRLEPAEGLDIGLGKPGGGARTSVDGGLLGLIIDARLGRVSASPEGVLAELAL